MKQKTTYKLALLRRQIELHKKANETTEKSVIYHSPKGAIFTDGHGNLLAHKF